MTTPEPQDEIQMLAAEVRELKAKNQKLRMALTEVIRIAPYGRCEMFHHGKEDGHAAGEPCPPLERYNDIIERAIRSLI